ncbi:hypothetical protein HPB48_015266 [Haemaphysalis longicornis]|uniref:TRAF1-6 MATH domain-containing protein n=1 Tax=Haemaphysalis longicornis TaxID=44386 RepID=A0A9J6FRZ3_HAELO|nr:hypothetical protein HPB48_015266 [Haemaphysalis longicornis]
MAHGRHEFALVGYSEDLEKKPLKFVDPIPAARTCSACSNVPRLTYYLLCGHTLCEPCYECCVTTSECVCPLDGEVCATADVSSKEYPVGNLLKRPSDKLVEFCHNFNHLSETLKEQFEALKTELKQASIQSIDRLNRNEAEVKDLAAHVKTIEQRAGGLDTKLSQLSLKSDTLSDKLLDKIAEVKALYTEKSEPLKTTITSALAPVPSDTKTHQRILTGYAALKENALKDGWSWSMSEKVYLRRYLLSWGIVLLKEGDIVYASVCAQLHEGKEDDFIDWPFTKEFRLSIIHPETRRERLLSGRGSSFEGNKERYSRPIKTSNRATRFDATRVESSDIERDGYVKEDELLLRFEVLE